MIVLKNIIRAPKRNIILFFIAFVLAFVMMAVLFVKDYAKDSISRSMGPLSNTLEVTVADGKPELKYDTAKDIRDGFGVITEMHAAVDTSCYIESVKAFEPKDESISGSVAYEPFGLLAVTDTYTLEEFYSGALRIVEGTGITLEHNNNKTLIALVSNDLAEKNGLKLGDPIRVSYGISLTDNRAQMTLYVGGIYDISSTVRQSAAYSYRIPANKIFIPISVYLHMGSEADPLSRLSVRVSRLYYEVKSPSEELAAEMEKRVSGINISDYRNVRVELFSPAGEIEALYKLSKVLDIAIIAVGVCFVASLLMVMLWSLRSRMKEIGIYCALGTKRRRVTALLMAESLLVFTAAFAFAVGAFSFIAARYGQDIYTALFYSSASADLASTTLENYISDQGTISAVSEVFRSAKDMMIEFVLPSAVRTVAVMLGAVCIVGTALYLYVRKTEVMRIVGGAGE